MFFVYLTRSNYIEWNDMNLKQLLLALFVAFQVTISSTALAWSPLEGVESAIEKMQRCYLVTAGSEENQEGEKEEGEEEEEPECD